MLILQSLIRLPVTSNVYTRPGASVPPSPAASAFRLPGLNPMQSPFGSNFVVDPTMRNYYDFMDGEDASNVHSMPSSPDSPASSAEERDQLGGLNIDISKNNLKQRRRQLLVRSMPDVLDRQVLTNDHEEEEDGGAYEDLQQKVLIAEARAVAWKQMVIELASGIQQTLQQPSSAANADPRNLLASAKQALSVALATS
jgi:hypothetical protein